MEREALLELYGEFVTRVAKSTKRQLGLREELDDLVQLGCEGLVEAFDRYDDKYNVRFKSFAYPRVRGKILDGVRTSGQLSRRAYARLCAAEAIDSASEPVLMTTDHLSTRSRRESLGLIDSILTRAATAYYAGLVAHQGEEDTSPEAAVLQLERRALMRKALAKLDEREQRIIEGRYFEGRRLDDVIDDVGLSRSRGRYLHDRALGKLRDALKSA